MDAGFNLTIYQAAPFIWGSAKDTTGMNFVYQGSPYVVVSQPPGASYAYDALGRLIQVNYTNLTTIVYNYDAMGNRISVVITCGPGGC